MDKTILEHLMDLNPIVGSFIAAASAYFFMVKMIEIEVAQLMLISALALCAYVVLVGNNE